MSFRSWLEEKIEWGGEPIERWRAIRIFVEQALVLFVKGHGYVFAYSDKMMANCIATGLYESRGKSCLASRWPGPDCPEGAADADDWHFRHIIGPDKWAAFWQRWGVWTDVDPTASSRGADRRMDIEAAVWRYLDLDLSPQTRVLNEIMAGGEEDEPLPSRPGQQGTDSYLQDAEHNGWGGYRR